MGTKSQDREENDKPEIIMQEETRKADSRDLSAGRGAGTGNSHKGKGRGQKSNS